MSKINKILVRAKRQVFSDMVGNNPSMFQGEGYDFVELREYMSGDDIRHIDWNITAKMQKPYIKVFREERELNVVLVSILNGSVYFGSKKFKQDLIAEIVALLGYATLKNGDLLSSYIFTDRVVDHQRATKKIQIVQRSVEKILEFDPLNEKVDFDFIADTLFKRIKKRSLIIMIGDFFEIPNFKVLAKKHEIIALVVRDRVEEVPPEMGFASLMDPQSGKVVEGDFNKESVQHYTQQIRAYDAKLFDSFKKSQIRFAKIYTDSYPSAELRKIFEAR